NRTRRRTAAPETPSGLCSPPPQQSGQRPETAAGSPTAACLRSRQRNSVLEQASCQPVAAHLGDMAPCYRPKAAFDHFEVFRIGEIGVERLIPEPQYIPRRQVVGSQWQAIIAVL